VRKAREAGPPYPFNISSTSLRNQIEWCLARPAHRAEPGRGKDFLELTWTRQGAENMGVILGYRMGAAHSGWGRPAFAQFIRLLFSFAILV